MKSLKGVKSLKSMKNRQAHPYVQTPELCYEYVQPSPLYKPVLIHANASMAEELGLDVDDNCPDDSSADIATYLTALTNGEISWQDNQPFAMGYAGHQFGHYVSRLGDGRAMNIGYAGGYQLQLKGAGPTRYSRSGDGRAVLRSSIREYLMSEAMHGLGIATTRALSLIGSAQPVYRERVETGAIVLRVASSWLRFGHCEYYAHSGQLDAL